MAKWTPADGGRGFEFTEILQPLEPFRDRITVVSDLAHAAWRRRRRGRRRRRTTRASAAVFLSGAHPGRGHAGASSASTVDQVAAQQIGQDTPLPSLELTIEEVEPELRRRGFSCAYRNTHLVADRRRRRCRWRTTRRSCSSGCSATAAPTRERAARRAAVAQPARLGARRRCRRCEKRSAGRATARGSTRVPRRRARDRAPHPEGRTAAVAPISTLPDAPAGVPDDVRRAHQADVRPAGAGLPGRTSRASRR